MIDLIWKENLEGMRRKQYFAIAIVLVGFALMSPVMMKVLPVLLESQTGSEELAAAIPVNLRESMRSYIKNIHQIATLMMVYLGASQMAYERGQRLIFSIHSGIEIRKMMRAKVLVYGSFIAAAAVIATIGSAIYGKLLLSGTMGGWKAMLMIGLELAIYLFFAYLAGLLFGAWIRNKMLATVLGSLTLFLMSWLAGFTAFEWIFPTYLLGEANLLIGYWTKPLIGCCLMAAAWCGLMMEAAVWKMERINYTAREE